MQEDTHDRLVGQYYNALRMKVRAMGAGLPEKMRQ